MKTLKSSQLLSNSMKRLLLILLLLNASLADNVCKYVPGQTIFRCDNVVPTSVITPGTEGEITVYCCFTGDLFNNSDEYSIITDIVTNHTFRKQHVYPNGSVWVSSNNTIYQASYWITSVDAPESAKGFTPFPVTIHFKMPSSGEGFLPGALFKARVDVMADLPGALTPNIPVLPNIMIPSDWTPFNAFKPVIISSLLLLAGIIIFKKVKFTKNHKKHETKNNGGGGEDFD